MMTWFKDRKINWSVAIGIGLMLSSSGLDGMYLTLWMPVKYWYLGLILNTAADIADLYLGHRIGKLIRSKDPIKRWGAVALGVFQVIAIAYSWFFGYRQLLRVLPTIEPVGTARIAFWAAGFIPIMLGGLGLESGLTAVTIKAFAAQEPAPAAKVPAPVRLECPECGVSASKAGRPFLLKEQVHAHLAHCPARGNGHEPAQVPAVATGASRERLPARRLGSERALRGADHRYSGIVAVA
jgi:hypothetical protein